MCNCKVKNFESTVIALLNIAFAAHIYRVEKAINIFVLSRGGAFAQFIFQAPLWGFSMNCPAPPRGFCSFPPPPKKKWQMPKGDGHSWNWLSHYLVYIGTKISIDNRWNFINFHYWSQFLFRFNIRKWWAYEIMPKVTVKLKIMHLL